MDGSSGAPDAGFQAIFEHALDPMLVADDDACYVDANPAACRLFGVCREELCRRCVLDFTPPEAKAEFEAMWRVFLDVGRQRGEYQLKMPDGRLCDIEFSATANVLPGRHLSIIRDVSDRKRLEAEREQLIARVQELARTDPLTELPNRRVWDERLTEEMHRARRSVEPLTIAIVDLDDFKKLNDTQGHAAGDRLLREVAVRWKGQLREIDLLARMGGDEFFLLLPDCSSTEQRRVVNRLRSVMPEGQTFSLGVATWDGAEEPARIFERADSALCEDKKGRTASATSS